MRKIILFLLLPLISNAQLKNFLLNEKTSFGNWELNTTNKQHVVDQLFAERHFKDTAADKENIENFHLVDFDLDGRNDVIFYGYMGGESLYMKFFRNRITHFEEIIGVAGKLVYLSEKKPYQPLSFAINQYGCCASINDMFELYTPTAVGNSFEFVLSTKIALIQGTTFPQTGFIDPVSFETINEQYTLRLKPIINNETEETPEDYDLPGNIIGIYPKKSLGRAIAQQKDSTGRLWYFVIMENNIVPIKSLFHTGYNNEKPYHSMGWMSSRFINSHDN